MDPLWNGWRRPLLLLVSIPSLPGDRKQVRAVLQVEEAAVSALCCSLPRGGIWCL